MTNMLSPFARRRNVGNAVRGTVRPRHGSLTLAMRRVASIDVGIAPPERTRLAISDKPLATVWLEVRPQAGLAVGARRLATITLGGRMDYSVGDTARVDVRVRNSSGVLADPPSLIARVRDPQGNVSVFDYAAGAPWARTAAGVYTLDIDLDEAGIWKFRVETSGANTKAAKEGRLTVTPSGVL